MNQNNFNQIRVICSLWLADTLTDKGFKLLGTGVNVNNPSLKVFYFEDSKELRQIINKIKGDQNGQISKSTDIYNN